MKGPAQVRFPGEDKRRRLKMKGIKKVATLIRYSKKETEIDPETGKERPKAIFFSVFEAQDVLKRK